MSHIETERKYVISMPDIPTLERQEGYFRRDIEQIYLTSAPDITSRIRRSESNGACTYFRTDKRRISAMSAIEDELEITADEYSALRENIAHGSRPIVKTRHTFTFSGACFEIDVYPGWQTAAVLETELPDEGAAVIFPPFIKVIKEVTGDHRYSNASMSRHFPEIPK